MSKSELTDQTVGNLHKTKYNREKSNALGFRKIRIRSLPVVLFFIIKNKIGAHCIYDIKNNVILLKSLGSDKPW